MLQNLKRSLLVSIWFVFLTFPLMAVRVNTTDQIVTWRWMNLLWVAIGAFVLSYAWRYMLERQQRRKKVEDEGGETRSRLQLLLEDMSFRYKAMAVLLALSLAFPLVVDTYQTNIMISALIYVVLGLGLISTSAWPECSISGMWPFSASEAYSYALLNHHFDLGFWTVLPVGGIIGCLCGVIHGVPDPAPAWRLPGNRNLGVRDDFQGCHGKLGQPVFRS